MGKLLPTRARFPTHVKRVRNRFRFASRFNTSEVQFSATPSFIQKLGWAPDQLTLNEDETEKFNRWKMVPVCILNHMCLGSIFAWSQFNQPLTCLNGVVSQASVDWTLQDINMTFSLVMGGFVWGAIFGKYLESFGPRVSCLIGATALGSGFGLAALATQIQSIPVLYAGGLTWGLANGWAYVPPVTVLMRWFPDRKGFASGGCIVGYGAGSMVAAPLFQKLLDTYRVIPEYVGSTDSVDIVNKSGQLFAEYKDALQEVVYCSSQQASNFDISEGYYVVGTGDTGAGMTFLIMGGAYLTTMGLMSFQYRFPKINENIPEEQKANLTTFNVPVSVASRTPQFWLLWWGFGLSITGSYGVIACNKTMLTDIFQTSMPGVVTAGFASAFVAAVGAANMGGRLGYSNLSDYLKKSGEDPFYGRRRAYMLMWSVGPLCYMTGLWSIHNAHLGTPALSVFCASMMGVIASFGGTAATRPAYAGDLFGMKSVSTITARQLSVVLPAAYIGPWLTATLRERSMNNSIRDLSQVVDDSIFLKTFSTSKDQLDSLIENKQVTLQQMFELSPKGTVDPNIFVYDEVMYTMASLQILALATNAIMKPVPEKYHS